MPESKGQRNLVSMGSLSQAKTLGGVGSILVILTAIPTVGWVLGIVGFIMTLIAVKYISDSLNDSTIFTNILISIILSIVGVAIAGIIVVAAALRFVGIGRVAGTTTPASIFTLIGDLIIALAVVWIVLIVSSYFLRKSYNTIATRLDVGMFRTGALLYFIGAILTIIFVGLILILVAQILFIVAFFSIPETPPAVGVMGGPGAPPPPPGSTMMGATSSTSTTAMGQVGTKTKFCVKCGASLDQNALFCPSCGASQQATST
jgi:uncharacterized membrane protein